MTKLNEEIRKSNLSRKIVKVEISQITELEIDVVDEGDIEPALTKFFQDGSNGGIGDYWSLENGNHLKELSSKFGGVSVLEVNDFNDGSEGFFGNGSYSGSTLRFVKIDPYTARLVMGMMGEEDSPPKKN